MVMEMDGVASAMCGQFFLEMKRFITFFQKGKVKLKGFTLG